MIKLLIKFFRPILIFVARFYWFVFRPKTSGAKVIVTCRGEIMLVSHTYGYKLTLPGGGIKNGEDPQEAAKRELKEEVGIIANDLHYLGKIVSNAEYKVDTIHVFHFEVPTKETSIDNVEIDYVEWQSVDNVKNVGIVTMQLINLYKSFDQRFY